jgi:Flp pilus assembly protein TadD
LLLADTKNYTRAISELEVAQRALPQEAKVYFALGDAYAHAGRKQEAARARATFLRLSRKKPAESPAAAYGEELSGAALGRAGP